LVNKLPTLSSFCSAVNATLNLPSKSWLISARLACPPAFPLATAAIAPLRAAAEARQSSDFTPLWAGQNTSGLRAQAAERITQDAIEAWNRTAKEKAA
jgi:hypothetical protein